MRIILEQNLDGLWHYKVKERKAHGGWLPICNGGPYATAEDALWRAEELTDLTRDRGEDNGNHP